MPKARKKPTNEALKTPVKKTSTKRLALAEDGITATPGTIRFSVQTENFARRLMRTPVAESDHFERICASLQPNHVSINAHVDDCLLEEGDLNDPDIKELLEMFPEARSFIRQQPEQAPKVEEEEDECPVQPADYRNEKYVQHILNKCLKSGSRVVRRRKVRRPDRTELSRRTQMIVATLAKIEAQEELFLQANDDSVESE
ncbi:hypothetical protein QR680_004711 [Steinernema hermaphroditum]|uniref:Uncharacterized protein n=1 Tax=Steinernema hermaphroditum TaxID=289476 RepID=A0AA39HRW1_9BILA|nr:hypothetical protein QR680_004711 [Steinernema hermaphroditum]